MPYQQVTLSQLKVLMQQQWDASAFWTDEEARRAINEALRIYNLFTGFWKRRVPPIPTVAGQVFYAVPGTLTVNLRMTFNLLSMTIGSLSEYDNGRPNWQAESTTDGGDVPTRPKAYIPVGLATFAIWPRDAVGGGSLLLDGVAATPVLLADGDFLDLGQEEITILLGEALHIVAFKERGRRWAATAVKHTAFLAACADRNKRLATNAYFRKYLGLDQEKTRRPERRADAPSPPVPQLTPGQGS